MQILENHGIGRGLSNFWHKQDQYIHCGHILSINITYFVHQYLRVFHNYEQMDGNDD